MELKDRIQAMPQMFKATAVSVQVDSASIPDAIAVDMPLMFREWASGESYISQEIIRYQGELYRIAQNHTSQDQWKPGETGTESLYTHITIDPETGYEVWQQPTGAHDAYNTGDRVLYPDENGQIYESLINGNTWAPDVYPQGWKLVEE